MDIPVDNNELVGGRSAIANPGSLKLLTDKRYLLFLKKLSQEIEKYPNDVLKKDLDNIFIDGQILNTNEQYFSGFYHPGLKIFTFFLLSLTCLILRMQPLFAVLFTTKYPRSYCENIASI
jgi:hypothetical protein